MRRFVLAALSCLLVAGTLMLPSPALAKKHHHHKNHHHRAHHRKHHRP